MITFFFGIAFVLLLRLDWYYLLFAVIFPSGVSIILNLILPAPIQSNNQNKKKVKASNNKSNSPKTFNRVPNNRKLNDHEILKLELKDISSRELERLCYLFYKSKGYKVEETKPGADGGIDLIYYHPQNGKTAVQIKHYIRSKNQISVEKIRELNSAKKNYGCVFSEFITTSTFTNPALREVPPGMDTKDIHWFEREVIPWMKKQIKKTS